MISSALAINPNGKVKASPYNSICQMKKPANVKMAFVGCIFLQKKGQAFLRLAPLFYVFELFLNGLIKAGDHISCVLENKYCIVCINLAAVVNISCDFLLV